MPELHPKSHHGSIPGGKIVDGTWRCGGCGWPIHETSWACYVCYRGLGGLVVGTDSNCSLCRPYRPAASPDARYCEDCQPIADKIMYEVTPDEIQAAVTELQSWTT